MLRDLPLAAAAELPGPLAETVAVVQHHDAVTGTERQHVADSYHQQLHGGLQVPGTLALVSTQRCCQASLRELGIETVVDLDQGDVTFCPLLNISQVKMCHVPVI